MLIQLSISFHFYLLICFEVAAMEMARHVFLGRLLVALKSVGSEKTRFQLRDVQSDVILPSCLHATAFSIDQLFCR